MARLFVIESPNKARTMEKLLAGMEMPARVQATVGHILQMPASLGDIGIDSTYREYERKPRDIKVVERLRAEAGLADEVFIATDADTEGDVIALDVATLIADIHPAPRRVRLKGMDADSVRAAIDAAGPVSKADAVAGRTRAIVDRLIGAGFSADGVSVGRVRTAILGLVASQKPVPLRIRLVAKASDGGRPWSAEADVGGPVDAAMARRLAEVEFPALKYYTVEEPPNPPGHMGDIMVRAGDRMGVSPKEASESMQRLFETGRMSYPRAGSRGVTPDVARRMQEVLRKAGYRVEAGRYPTKGEKEVHDAPHPIGPVETNRDITAMGQDEGLRTMVGRDLVKCGLRIRIERPTTMNLVAFLVNRGFPEAVGLWVSDLPWRRESGPTYPGKETWPEQGVEERRPDTVLLERIVAAGLGRPSTWAKHVDGFMARGLVDADLALTAKGRAWAARSPAELLDPRMSAAIERACEDVRPALMADPDREPWEVNAERIVRVLPPRIRQVVEGLVAGVPPQPLPDPVADLGLGESAVDAARAAALALESQPRPRAEA